MGHFGICEAYCSHGGVCDLDAGHEGLHSSSGHCRWSDAESVTKAEADAILVSRPGGAEILALQDAIEGLGPND